MIILDTNIVSALMNADRDPAIVAWLDAQPQNAIWTTAITVYEVRLGLTILPEGRKRRRLEEVFGQVIAEDLGNRVLEFDFVAAEAAASLAAHRRQRGINVEIRDTQIAGIVLTRQATLVTRNVRHFSDIEAHVVNPWKV